MANTFRFPNYEVLEKTVLQYLNIALLVINYIFVIHNIRGVGRYQEEVDEEPGPVARMPTDDLMNSEVAILTGGRDQQGRQLITLPARHHGLLESKVKATGLGRLLRYFMDSSRMSDKRRGFGYVADLRFATIDFVSMLKSTLSSLQAEMRETVGACVLYAIQPISKKTCKDTLTLMNLRKSKKKQNKHMIPPLFQVVMAADEMDLYNFIDRSHLTPDLGGYLQYSHNEWLRFRKAVEPFFVSYESLEARLPTGYERLINLSHQHAQESSKEELQQMLHRLRGQYEEIRRDINLEPVSDLCDSLQARFEHSENDPVIGPMAQKPIFRETKSMLAHCHRELTSAEKKLEALWEGASGKLQQTIDVMTFNEQVKQLQDWFTQKGWKELKRKVEIADTLSRAEMLCNHFDTGLHSKAKAKVAQADGLIQHAETMVLEHKNQNIVSITTAAKQLKEQTQEFKAALNKRKTMLQMVYEFFFVYEKAAKWVTRVLKFLPDNLIDLFSDLQGKKRKDHSSSRENQWQDDVKRFLRRYPPPNREELAKARQAAEVIPENKAKKQGRVLVHRCLVLLRILSLKEVATMRDVVEAVKWQEVLLSNNTDALATEKEQRRVPPSDSSWTSPEGDASRSRPPPNKGKVRELPRRGGKVDVDDAGRRGQQRTLSDRPSRKQEEPFMSGYDEADAMAREVPHRNWPRRDVYSAVSGAQRQGIMQRPMYLPGGTGQEVQAVPIQSKTTLPSHARLNGGMPATQQEMHNQSFGIYGESDHEGDIGNGYRYANGPNLYPVGEIPQGLPSHQLPGNRYLGSQDYSLFPHQVPGRPTKTSSPNSYSLSPTGGRVSGDPSPIPAPNISSLNSTQQSPPLRPYKSMVDVRQPLSTDADMLARYPPSMESSHLGLDPSRPSLGDNTWMISHPRLQHGKSEPGLNQLQQNPVSSPYNDILENLSSMRLDASRSNHETLSRPGYEPPELSNYIHSTSQPNPQAEYYQRLFGTDSPSSGQFSSERFHDRSPYDISVPPQRLPSSQKQQQLKPRPRHIPATKLPPSKTSVPERMSPEQLDHAGALPSLTPLDILEYELAADKEYLAEEIADDKYRMEKEHQAMIESILNEPAGEPDDNHTRHYDFDDLPTNFPANPQYRRRSKPDPRQNAGRTNNPTKTTLDAFPSHPSTPSLPEILSSPPPDALDDNWDLYAAGAHGISSNMTMTVDELDDTSFPPEYGAHSTVHNEHSLAPLTDRLKAYFEDDESSQPVQYERMLEEAQRNREASQEVLRREMDRYNDVLMHREELAQQDLQDRLYKIEEKLQEEEAILKQEAELDYLMEIERRRDYASHKHASHNYDLSQFELRRDNNLHLSDEGVIFDGASVDEAYEHASTITTERESVESGLGLRRSRSGGSQNVSAAKEKSDSRGNGTLQSKQSSTRESDGLKQKAGVIVETNQSRRAVNHNLQHVGAGIGEAER